MTIRVLYHYEDSSWWADSVDVPGWTAVGATFDEVRQLTHEGVREFVGADVIIEEEGLPVAVMSSGAAETGTLSVKVDGALLLEYAVTSVPTPRADRVARARTIFGDDVETSDLPTVTGAAAC